LRDHHDRQQRGRSDGATQPQGDRKPGADLGVGADPRETGAGLEAERKAFCVPCAAKPKPSTALPANVATSRIIDLSSFPETSGSNVRNECLPELRPIRTSAATSLSE
jgi:hypothetical protein